mgnify:CR=1 FL=1
MSDDEEQCRGAIIHYSCRLGFTKQGERTLDINAAPAAFAFRKIVFEIRIRCPDFIQCVHGFAGKRGASEICVNDDSGSVDDRLKSAGAKLVERVADIVVERVAGEVAGIAALVERVEATQQRCERTRLADVTSVPREILGDESRVRCRQRPRAPRHFLADPPEAGADAEGR